MEFCKTVYSQVCNLGSFGIFAPISSIGCVGPDFLFLYNIISYDRQRNPVLLGESFLFLVLCRYIEQGILLDLKKVN